MKISTKETDVRRDETINRERVHSHISIYHEQVLERRVDSDNVLDLVHLGLAERIHQGVEMDLVNRHQ